MTTPNTQGASWDGKRTIIPKTRHFGKATAQNESLLREIHAGQKYVVFHGISGIVHVVPDAKLKEMLSKERAEGERKLEDWKDSYQGKLWSTAVQKCFEAPFVEVAIQHLLHRISQQHEKAIKEAERRGAERAVKKILSCARDMAHLRGLTVDRLLEIVKEQATLPADSTEETNN